MAEWWESEPDALHEALASVAQWEQCVSPACSDRLGEDETSSASWSSSEGPSSGTSNATCDEDAGEGTYDVRKAAGSSVALQSWQSRGHQGNEEASLRAEIWRLEGKLRDLSLEKARETSRGQLVAWEGMATSQRSARREAEQLNKELRAAVAQQARIAEELLKRIRQVKRVAGNRLPEPVRIPRALHERAPTDQQWRRLDVITSHWREAFALCDQFQNGPTRFIDSRIIQVDEHGGLVDLYASAVVPFPVRLVSRAFWLHYQEATAEGKGHRFDRVLESVGTDDRLASEFSVRGAYGCVYGKCVKRRLLTEEGNPLFVTHSNLEPQRPCEPQFDIPMYQDSWVRLAARPGQVHHTVIQTVRRSCISFSREDPPPQLKVAEGLARFILRIMETETKWTQQSVENTLMRPSPLIQSK